MHRLGHSISSLTSSDASKNKVMSSDTSKNNVMSSVFEKLIYST